MSEVIDAAPAGSAAPEPSAAPSAPPPELALINSIGSERLHRWLARMPRRVRYLVWHAMSNRLINQDALANMMERAERNMVGFAPNFSTREDLARLARTHGQELRNDYCMVLSGAPDMYRPKSDGFVRLVGHEAFLEVAAQHPTVLLGNHLSAYHSAVIALAAHKRPIHLIALKPPPDFQRRWSHFEDLGRLYIDWALGPTIPTIFVPDPTASVRILRAMRKREPVWAAADTDIGAASRENAVSFLGGWVAPPRALYEIAVRENARFYTINIDRHGAAARPWEHRFVVTVSPIASPDPNDLAKFHQERLDAVSERICRTPARWTIWRYWFQGAKAP
jgi:hypothetical protein